MKKIISYILLLAMCVSLFAACNAEPAVDADLESAKEYLYAFYKDAKSTTDADFDVISQVRIGEVVYPITWTADKADNVQIVAGENNMTTVKITAGAEEVNYKLTATLKNEQGQEVSVSFDYIIPAKAQVSGKTFVLAYPKESKFITGSHYLYTGKNKWQLELTENEADAIALEVLENSDGTVTFKAGDQFLYCDATHVKFVATEDDNTKFVLEAADTEGGYFIKCAVANYNGKAQYLEVYSGYLTCYGMGSDPSIYVFKLQESSVAAGTISGLEGAAPDASEPAATDPAATDPAATTPAATDPAATTPAATTPPATQPTTPPATQPTTPPATQPSTPSSSKVVLSFPKEGKYVTGKHSLYEAKNKWQLELTDKKSDAIALEMIKNSDGSVSFKSGSQYLYCDATHVKFVAKQDDNTKFVLEDTNGGVFIKCAVANYNGKAQYLEVYSGVLTCYGMGADASIYTFKLEDGTGAKGTISGYEENAGGNSGNNNSGNTGNNNSGNTGNNNSGEMSTPTGDYVMFDFTGLTEQGKEIPAENALAVFNSVASGSGLTAVTVSKIYNGNATGGAHPNASGFIRCGKSDADGELVMTFSKKVAKVEILCHDWYSKSDSYPTNNHQVAINGGTPQLAPYNETGAGEVMTFNLDGTSNVVDFDFSSLQSGKTGRVFIFKMIITFA